MSLDASHKQKLDVLEGEVRRAQRITPDLVARVIDRACRAQHPTAKAAILRLIGSGAFVEGALAMLELEPPAWKLRRLAHDAGEWHCSLSRQLALPAELDVIAEASHEILPLAILNAFVETRRTAFAANGLVPKTVPRVRRAYGCVACCDNFR